MQGPPSASPGTRLGEVYAERGWTSSVPASKMDARTFKARCRSRSHPMRYRNDPAGTRLPIKLDTATNGEFEPIPLEAMHHLARRLAFDAATANARRQGLSRRAFLV